ncbi:BON domain-containing class I SAM-dependent methyltransferase [Dactylosporangium sp. NPDC005572]|uniref:BON domain-containing class I SAM-dependent methyltransferase n=1 Tax=Dactylosporangium sp. NPDC005572 TaxID=3156889 RepID=UPI0033ACC6B2
MTAQSRALLRDHALSEIAADVLAHDERVRDFSVEVRFDRGVALVSGAVRYPAQARLLREMLGRLDGVLAVWDRLWVDGRPPVVVDVRCSTDPRCVATVGTERRPDAASSLVADAGRGLPLADASVDRLYAVHVLEFLPDYLPLVDDCHRVLRQDGVLHIMAPYWQHPDAVADPTLRRVLDVQTVKGICTRPGAPQWFPLHAASDGESVFADLVPLPSPASAADDVWLSRFFD